MIEVLGAVWSVFANRDESKNWPKVEKFPQKFSESLLKLKEDNPDSCGRKNREKKEQREERRKKKKKESIEPKQKGQGKIKKRFSLQKERKKKKKRKVG